MSGPRVLAIMGSGEIGPAMAKVHRALFERFGDEPAPAVLVDTPYGFQENVVAISERIVAYFRERIGRKMSVASYRRDDADPVAAAAAFGLIRDARFILAGPGSPSYALRHWRDGPVPEALADTLATGGVVVMASAAALTLGVATVPVYEIYKVGMEPAWLEGLDLLGRATGLRAAVIPHYDNAEGGDHDTRFCYLGERRLAILEATLPADAFVLGVDGHTALVLDLEKGTAAVAGLGGATVRVAGRSVALHSGRQIPIERLVDAAEALRAGRTQRGRARLPGWGRRRAGEAEPGRGPAERPLHEEASRLEGGFAAALGNRDPAAAVAALIELDELLEGRTRGGEDSPELDAARATFRALIVRLGDALSAVRPPDETIDPFVGTLLELRARARAGRDWEQADFIRDRLASAGVEVHDRADGGSTWSLAGNGRRDGPQG